MLCVSVAIQHQQKGFTKALLSPQVAIASCTRVCSAGTLGVHRDLALQDVVISTAALPPPPIKAVMTAAIEPAAGLVHVTLAATGTSQSSVLQARSHVVAAAQHVLDEDADARDDVDKAALFPFSPVAKQAASYAQLALGRAAEQLLPLTLESLCQLPSATPAAEGPLQPCLVAAVGAVLAGAPSAGGGRPTHVITAGPLARVAAASGAVPVQLHEVEYSLIRAPRATSAFDMAHAVHAGPAHPAHLLYSTAWQAAESSSGGHTEAGAPHFALNTSKYSQRMSLSAVDDGSLLAATSAAMQVLQASAGSHGGQLYLSVSGRFAASAAACSAQELGTALPAMLRCVANEHPRLRSAVCIADPAEPGRSSSSSLAAPADTHGQLHAAGALHVPRLLVSGEQGVARSRLHLRSCLVTGGTGALGVLAARWFADGCGVNALLLSRSGRLQTGDESLVLGPSQLSITS